MELLIGWAVIGGVVGALIYGCGKAIARIEDLVQRSPGSRRGKGPRHDGPIREAS